MLLQVTQQSLVFSSNKHITGMDLINSGDTALNGAITLGNASSDAITVTGTPTGHQQTLTLD